MNPRRLRIAIPVLVVVAVVVWLTTRNGDGLDQFTASGTVEATEAQLGFQMAGRIESLVVREGDATESGDTLVYLDRAELLARRDAAGATVAAARAVLAELLAGSRSEDIAGARAALRAAAQRRADAQRDVDRSQRLLQGGAVSREVLDKHETAVQVAAADEERIREQLALVVAGPRPERIAAQRAAVRQAEAQLAQIDVALRNATVVAPFAGLVSVKHREAGEIVAPGAPVLTLMNPDDRWIRIYVREDAVGRLALGQDVSITADAYEDRTYGGSITYISSEAEFTPRNVQTTEERVRLVYEVRVRVIDDPTFDLKPGLAADVRIAPPGS